MIKKGDIFLTDSDKLGPRIVKFLMVAPTWYQYLWRRIIGKNEKVRFYHAGIILNDLNIIEQQWKVHLIDRTKKVLSHRHIVWQKKNLTDKQRELIVHFAKRDLGETYDVLLILGKTLTWLTGIKLFTRVLQLPEKEICVTRIAYWYYLAFGETFGKPTWHEITTDNIDNYCLAHSDEWEAVSIKEE